MEKSDFERFVIDAVARIPEELRVYLDNVDILVEDLVDPDQLAGHLIEDGDYLLGLYEGVPLTERHEYSMLLPDKITLFQKAIEEVSSDNDDLIDQIRQTVIHEIAHHFGISDDRLEELDAIKGKDPMDKYLPSPARWVADQVELYEGSDGTEGTTLRDFPVIIVTNKGRKTGAIRKTPLMRVVDGDCYVLIASLGGAPNHPLWYHNIKSDPNIQIRDQSEIFEMKAREIDDPIEKQRLWNLAVDAYPLYKEYQDRTDRVIPVLLAELSG